MSEDRGKGPVGEVVDVRGQPALYAEYFPRLLTGEEVRQVEQRIADEWGIQLPEDP